jgi:hypothetical protein
MFSKSGHLVNNGLRAGQPKHGFIKYQKWTSNGQGSLPFGTAKDPLVSSVNQASLLQY